MIKILAVSVALVAGFLVIVSPTLWWGACIFSRAVWLFCLPSPSQIRSVTVSRLSSHVLREKILEKKISLVSALLLIIKMRLFPLFLLLYLLLLFVHQTHFFSLHFTRLFLLLDPFFLLYCLAIFVFFLWGFPQHTRKSEYIISRPLGLWGGRLCLFLIGCVASSGVWVVWQTSYDLGLLAQVISASAGSLIVLGGFFLFQDEDGGQVSGKLIF